MSLDDTIAITMEGTPCIIFSVGDTGCVVIETYKMIFANVAFLATTNRISSNNFFVGGYGWC